MGNGGVLDMEARQNDAWGCTTTRGKVGVEEGMSKLCELAQKCIKRYEIKYGALEMNVGRGDAAMWQCKKEAKCAGNAQMRES